MKVIIYRDKETKKIVRDAGDDYELLKARGKTDEDIAALVEEFNSREDCPQTVEIVELNEIAEYYMTRKLNAYRSLGSRQILRNTVNMNMTQSVKTVSFTEKALN